MRNKQELIDAIKQGTAFIGTKLIDATPMTRAEYNLLRGWELPSDENGDDEGYMVSYANSHHNTDFADAYISWSPKDVFEQSYQGLSNLDFSHALHFAKHGRKIARAGWNGKGMYVALVEGNLITEAVNYCLSSSNENMQAVPVLDSLYLKTATGELVPWLASQTDLLANDWCIVS